MQSMKKGVLPVSSAKDGPAGTRKKSGSRVDGDQLLVLLQQHFGYSSFRGRQLEVIETVLSGEDCLCLLPTGGGKSMCYELPALARPGVVLVISPLIALMESQVSALKAQKISAEYLSSTQSQDVKSKIYEELESGKPSLRLLYVTPELIATTGFLAKLKKLHRRGLLTLIAIDEAHCISSWGHDFRPSYRKLSSLRYNLPGIPLLALTATASAKVQKDIITSLCLREPRVLLSSFNRHNIYYEVRYKDVLKDSYVDLLNTLKKAPKECAIIYCHSRATCDDIGSRLLKDGISCRVYHAGLGDNKRSCSLDEWTSSEVPVMVATVAFGMGIDRKDVRLVCHFNMPKTLEGFYQESGRAGRDRKPARSILYYGLEDKRIMDFILTKEAAKKKVGKTKSNAGPDPALEAFSQMVNYCEEKGCRRQKVLAHFGEKVSLDKCNKTCDACRFPKRICEQLEELAEAKRNDSHSRSLSSSIVFSNQNNANWCQTASEFWTNEDDEDGDGGSEDEISDSEEDEAEAEAAAAVRKQKEARVEKKVDALLRAEEDYSRRQGLREEKSSLQDKKTVPESSRDIARQRLQSAVVRASERVDWSLHAESAAGNLEQDCYKKYGKAGRTIYNSQLASTIRWLSSCSKEALQGRVLPAAEAATAATASAASASASGPALKESESQAGGGRLVGAVGTRQALLPEETARLAGSGESAIALPSIPSMAEFMKGSASRPLQEEGDGKKRRRT